MNIQQELQAKIDAAYHLLGEARRNAETARDSGNKELEKHWQNEADRRYDTCRNLMRQQR